jgi:hypothetical protein
VGKYPSAKFLPWYETDASMIFDEQGMYISSEPGSKLSETCFTT